MMMMKEGADISTGTPANGSVEYKGV